MFLAVVFAAGKEFSEKRPEASWILRQRRVKWPIARWGGRG
ncbi:hypothetical protein KKC1_30010 [Calderihabitans maritimus]|uniref:Uncharacterized protein n=1 Tax=Calderihabitans maritimus TaxID=1246530 RepID=A0A1Z5HWG6_9FIRM|nr:hypothetical protein KKC1_30010 [Calderihabitans maritimus]